MLPTQNTKTTTNRSARIRARRKAFIWHLFEHGYSIKEVAHVCGVTSSHVNHILDRQTKPGKEPKEYYEHRRTIMYECLDRGWDVYDLAEYFKLDVKTVYSNCPLKKAS